MVKVIHPNASGSTADGMTKYRFSGSPTDQYEHRGEVGEVRTMSVTVECVAEGFDQINDGVRHQTKWKVLNATLGEVVERPAEPTLFDGEDEEKEKGKEYGDYNGTSASEDTTPDNVVTPSFSG